MSVSDKVKAGLKMNGKEMQNLAELLNISRQSMSNKFYRDSFSAEELITIADWLGFKLAFINDNQKIVFELNDIKESKRNVDQNLVETMPDPNQSTIETKKALKEKVLLEKQKKAIETFIKNINDITSEPLGEEYDEILSQRITL